MVSKGKFSDENVAELMHSWCKVYQISETWLCIKPLSSCKSLKVNTISVDKAWQEIFEELFFQNAKLKNVMVIEANAQGTNVFNTCHVGNTQSKMIISWCYATKPLKIVERERKLSQGLWW